MLPHHTYSYCEKLLFVFADKYFVCVLSRDDLAYKTRRGLKSACQNNASLGVEKGERKSEF